MAKRHKKGHHEEHIDETWLIPYADLLTLLLALFIVLFAAANVDQKKFEQVSQAMQEAFHEGGNGILDPGSAVEPNDKKNEPKDTEDEFAQTPNEPNVEELTEELKREFERLEDLKASIDQYIKEEGMQTEFTTAMNKKGLLITIQDGVLFESGSADLKAESVKIAESIAHILSQEEERDVVISGHTDNIPIRNGKYRSNWDLSAMRGINFLQAMLNNKELNPVNFSVNGYGEYHPKASNETANGREENRRVEVLILPNTTN